MSDETYADGADDGDGDDASSEDLALLDDLRAAAAAHDPVPGLVVDAARAALTWRTIDDDLAALTFDSSVDAGAMLVRSAGVVEERLLTFSAAYVTVDLQVSTLPEGRVRLLGQLEPATAAQVHLRWPGGEERVETDELGRMPAVDVPAGPLSLRIRLSGIDNWVSTEWTVV